MDFDNTFNKNDKQIHFNQIKGVLSEINDGEKFCNITLSVGHENVRSVNLVMKKHQFESLLQGYKIGDKLSARFYITSRKKLDRWFTTANLLALYRED